MPTTPTPGAAAELQGSASQQELCHHCSKDLMGLDRALFVEEEVGRVFCSEKCIADYFSPEIERLERTYFRHVSPKDLTGQERESLAHLRWITLQEPDEVWREKTLTGDHRFTLISRFQPGNRDVWCICICLFLRGEPSFLYLAFPTRNEELVNLYRKGERVQWVRAAQTPQPGQATAQGAEASEETESEVIGAPPTDRLGEPWTEEETFQAQVNRTRSPDDIPVEEYEKYQGHLEQTLEEPDELWTYQKTEQDLRLFHFIRHYPDSHRGVWFVIVARETEEQEQIEILDAFPTRDSTLVDHYRRGEQEDLDGTVAPSRAASRVVH